MGKYNKYTKETTWYKNKFSSGGGGGSVGAFEPEPYEPINLGEFLKAPSTEEISQKQNILLTFEKDYKAITLTIDTDYELYKDYTKQLDDLEEELRTAPPDMEFNLNQKYNQIRDEHNILVERLQGNTKKQKEIYEGYTKIRETFDKDIELYNRWATAQNEKEPEPEELEADIGEFFTPEETAHRLKEKIYRTGEKENPTWGEQLKNWTVAGLNYTQGGFYKALAMVDEGFALVDEEMGELRLVSPEKVKAFEEKHGFNPYAVAPLTGEFKKIAEESHKRADKAMKKTETRDKLQKLMGMAVVPAIPVLTTWALTGGVAPTMTGMNTIYALPWAETLTQLGRMTPFMIRAFGSYAYDIKEKAEALGEEMPYWKHLTASMALGFAEGASELEFFLGMSALVKKPVQKAMERGAKTLWQTYAPKAGTLAKTMFSEFRQEATMPWIQTPAEKMLGFDVDMSLKGMAKESLTQGLEVLPMIALLSGIGGGISASTTISSRVQRIMGDMIENKKSIKDGMKRTFEELGFIPEEQKAFAYALEETPDKKKVEPQEPGKIFKGKAWRAETGVTKKETAQEIVDFEAKELGNEKVKMDAEKVAKGLGVKLEEVIGEDIIWVTKTKKEAEEYGEAEKIKIKEPSVILATDPDGGFLVLQNADKYIKTPKAEPKAPTTLKLLHLSTEQQLKEIDPEYMGTGQAGEEMKRVGEKGFKKTSAWYTEETPKIEPRFFNNMLYTTKVESKDIYNWKENPEGFKTHTEIKEAGYKGYKIDDQVRLFEKVKVVKEGTVVAGKGEKVAAKDIEKLIAPLKKIIDISSEIVELHNKNSGTDTEEMHGATYNLYDGDLIGKDKFAVSVYPDRGITVNSKKITPKVMAKFIEDNIDLLKKPINSIGTWYDKESKKTYIDISQTVDTLEEAIGLGKEFKQKAIFDLKTLKEIPVKKSLEEQLKESQKEINRLKGIIKTIKGNKEKRQAFKKDLVEYIKKNMPFAIQNKMLATVKNVSGDKALEKAMEKVDQYTIEHYTRQYTKAIDKELKAKRIKPKRMKSGMLKGRFIPVVQDKLDFIRANINGSRSEAIGKIQKNIELFNKGEATNIAEENELLNMVGTKEMDLETLQLTLANIKGLKEEGKTLRAAKIAKDKERHEQDIIKALQVVTGKEVEIDKESGKAILDSSYKTLPKSKKWVITQKTLDKIINWQYGWDNLLDKLSALDKTSKPYESDLSKIGDKVHYARSTNIAKLEDVLSMIQVKFAEAFEVTSRKEINKICQKLREEIDLGEFKNSEGSNVYLVLTKEQILKKVMQLDDPTLEATFTDGMFYTEEIENALRNSVTDKELAWIKGVKEVYEYIWERINPIFEEMYGIHFPHNPNYSGTIRRDIDIDIPEASLMAQDAFKFASILNPSLKARSKTKQSLKYDDMTSSLMNYVMQMEHFIAWAKPLQDLRNVFGDKRVKSTINELYGRDTLNKINGFLDDMTRDGVDKAKIVKLVDTIRFNFTRSILAKPHIALKQIPSVLAYMTEMPVVDFFEGVGNFWKNPIKNYRYLVEHSAYARARFGEGFERDIHGAMKSDYVHLLSRTHKISDMTMGMVRAGDKFAVMQGMWAKFYSETKGQTTKANNAEEAIRRAEIVTQRTQPSFTTESLATGQRGGSFLKLFTMFQNQPNKYFRIIADNARNFKAGRGSRMKAASNIALAWAILPMLFQFIGDGGKWIEEHQLRALILGAVNDLLVIGSIIRGMYGWLIKEAYDVNASPVFATLREIEYSLAKIAKWKDPGKDITPEDIQAFTEHFAKGLGQLIGLPTPYGVQVKKAIESGDYRQLLFSEYILNLGEEKKKKKKPYVKSYGGDKYSKYLKSGYSKKSKYKKYLK